VVSSPVLLTNDTCHGDNEKDSFVRLLLLKPVISIDQLDPKIFENELDCNFPEIVTLDFSKSALVLLIL